MYGRLQILDIISPTGVHLRLPNRGKIYPVVYVSLIEHLVKGNWDFDLNAVVTTTDPIDNDPECDIDKVIRSTEKDGNVVHLVKWTR
jgi:hypothetical protein